jgi:nuclear pore complex protein Nup98-Nup96
MAFTAPTVFGAPAGFANTAFGAPAAFGGYGAGYGAVAPTAFGAYGAPAAFGGYGAPYGAVAPTAFGGPFGAFAGNTIAGNFNNGAVLGGYTGYGAATTGTGAGYTAASYIPPAFGPSGFNASGLSSWSGYSSGTTTLAPQAVNGGLPGTYSGYAGLASTAPLPWGATVAGIPGYGAFGGQGTAFNPAVVPSTIAGTASFNPAPQGRVAPPPPTSAPAGYE